MKRDVFILRIEINNNYIDIIRTIDECDMKRDIKRKITVEWNHNIVNDIEKLSLSQDTIDLVLHSFIHISDLPFLYKKNNNVIKRMINKLFVHDNNLICNSDYEKEKY